MRCETVIRGVSQHEIIVCFEWLDSSCTRKLTLGDASGARKQAEARGLFTVKSVGRSAIATRLGFAACGGKLDWSSVV